MASGWPQNDGVALDSSKPRPLGICDFCGRTYHLQDLGYQFEWSGFQLQNLHFRVCPPCRDKPQEQLRSIILPPDPLPAIDPRPPQYTVPGSAEYLQIVTNLNGFVQNVIGDVNVPVQDKTSVLAASQVWGVPQPALTDRSGTIAALGVVQQIMPANLSRTYLMVYNPTDFQFCISLGTPAFSDPASVVCGVGTALLQNSFADQPPTMWTGAVYILSTGSAIPFFAWESA